MANGMGALWVAASGLQNSQNALNTTGNNLANVDTPGYVRQQVLFEDRKYLPFAGAAAISKQTAGLGVSIADVLHNRDVFLDQSYRTETGRQIFYSTNYEATKEVENLFQEMNGEAFQEILSGKSSLWVAFQEFVKDPSLSVNQTLVLQKASLFVTRSKAVYSGLKEYQQEVNVQINDNIDRINELGNTIKDLNLQIQKIEAGKQETAMNLRDERDLALDELAKLAKISYNEEANGIVTVSVEGQEFVTEVSVYEMGKKIDKTTGLITPIWPHLKDQEVFNLKGEISSELNTDIGELKALVLARGDRYADYRDMLVSGDVYAKATGQSVAMNTEAEFDNLIHAIVTTINDLLCPNTTAKVNDATNELEFLDANGDVLYRASGGAGGVYYLLDENGNQVVDANGNRVEVTEDTKFLDTNTASTGSDGKLPPQELFSRIGCERYTEITSGGKTYYMYNNEDLTDTSKMYTTQSIIINNVIKEDSSMIPCLKQNGEVNYDMAEAISKAWSENKWVLNPTQTGKWSFAKYYEQMVGELGMNGTIFKSTAADLESTVSTINTRRNSVIGVSSDEELTNMIRFQNGYNAASRYMNVVSEMIEHIIEKLG